MPVARAGTKTNSLIDGGSRVARAPVSRHRAAVVACHVKEWKKGSMPNDTKRQAVAELAELLRTSSAMAVTDYRGLKVSDMQAVRRTLRDAGVQLTIAKNRL